MSQQNIEALRGLQEAFNAGDLEAALEAFDPGAEWQQAREDPDAETLYGSKSIRRLWESWREAYPDLRIEADEVIAMAERVFVWVRITGHGRSSGVEVALEEAYVYTFRDGIIVRLEEYFDRQRACARPASPGRPKALTAHGRDLSIFLPCPSFASARRSSTCSASAR